MDRNILEQLGLNHNEIDLYLSLLRGGSSTAPQLAKTTGIDKATIYRCLDQLSEKGLVAEVVMDKVKRFTGASPDKLIERLDTLRKEVMQMLPELDRLAKLPRTHALVELYQGKEGIKTVMKDILKEGKPYFIIGHAESFFREIPTYCEIWLRTVERKHIPGKLICPKSESFEIAKTEELRYLPKELTSLISTWIYGNKTAQFIMTNPAYVILIDNVEVAESNKKFFNGIWRQAK